MPYERPAVAGLLIFCELLLLLFPLLRYVSAGWLAKRADIMDGLGPDARMAYFQMFKRNLPTPARDEACEKFDALYSDFYGRKFFLFPGILLFLVGIIATTSVTSTILGNIGYLNNRFSPLPYTAISALAGAYLWVANDLISRARRLDFSPSDILWGCLRLVIAVPMGYAFATIDTNGAIFIAFALGAFPLTSLISMIQRLANKILNLDGTALETTDDIIKLQGINRTIVERLANEDVTTVTQFAYCDPVQLVMRSNLRFNFVTDCMNQALAWMYFESLMALLRPLGLRGAVEIRQLIHALDNAGATAKEVQDRNIALKALPEAAKATGIDADALQLAFRQVGEDPYTEFLERVWVNKS